MKDEYLIRRVLNPVHSCRKCGEQYGNSACGFGKENNPAIFFIGMNPWVKDHQFDDGRGIKILKRKFKEWGFEDFFFDNVVKCQMPGDFKPGSQHASNCFPYLEIQIAKMNPRVLVTFGLFASESMELSYSPWGLRVWGGIGVYTLPHFSKPLYEGKKSIEKYYENLYELLEEEGCLEQ